MIKIDILKNYPEATSALALLWRESIGKFWAPEVQLEEIISWFDEWLNDDIPILYIALDATKPIGMCSLQYNDGIRPDLKPWIGDFCIDIAYRNRGIGKQLLDTVKQHAKLLGFNKLYLFAPDPNIPPYYIKLNWKKIGLDTYHGHTVTVMDTDI